MLQEDTDCRLGFGSLKKTRAQKNDMRKISAVVPLSCPSFGPPLSAGLKTAIVMGNILQLWGSNLFSFGCPHKGVLA